MSSTTASGRRSAASLTAGAAGVRHPHLPALVAQRHGQQLGDVDLVVDDEHADRRAVGPGELHVVHRALVCCEPAVRRLCRAEECGGGPGVRGSARPAASPGVRSWRSRSRPTRCPRPRWGAWSPARRWAGRAPRPAAPGRTSRGRRACRRRPGKPRSMCPNRSPRSWSSPPTAAPIAAPPMPPMISPARVPATRAPTPKVRLPPPAVPRRRRSRHDRSGGRGGPASSTGASYAAAGGGSGGGSAAAGPAWGRGAGSGAGAGRGRGRPGGAGAGRRSGRSRRREGSCRPWPRRCGADLWRPVRQR